MNANLLKTNYELNLENKALKKQNSILTFENKAFKKSIESIKKKQLEFEANVNTLISKAVNDAVGKVTVKFEKQLAEKDKQIDKLTKEVKRLKSQINKDSSNSSKPSSTNGFKDVVQNNREITGKKPGGQPGHQGHKLELPENLEELIKDEKIQLIVKDNKIAGKKYTDEYISKYELDIEIKAVLIEHRFYDEISKNNIVIPPKIPINLKNNVNYGINIKSLSSTLSLEGIIANKRLADFFKEISHGIIKPSTATIISFNELLAHQLDTTNQIEVIKNDLLNKEVMWVDDTVIKSSEIPDEFKRECEDRKVFRTCLRNHSNEESTLFTFNAKKDEAGIISDDILPNYYGILIQDFEAKFSNYGNDRGYCHPHINRELKSVFENLAIEFAPRLISFFNNLNNDKKELIAKKVKKITASRLKAINKEYDEIIAEGREQLKPLKDKYYYNETSNLLMRLEDYKHNYILFIKDFKVDYSNNLSERELRPTKTKAKVSGVFRSYKGGKIYAKNRSFVTTIKKRELNIFESIKSILNGNPVLA